jgi:AcrR family transcriptional regulator
MSRTAARQKSDRARTSRRAEPRRHAASEHAIQQMLAAAERVLIRDGYHAFSTRRVATECGVSVGHLTYYFPAKIELLRAMIVGIMGRYTARLRRDLAATPLRKRAQVAELVTWLLRDSVTEETSGLFRELWVMAKHDTVVAREVIRFYEGLMEAFVELVTPLYPRVERKRLQQTARLIATLTEGATVIFANPGERTVSFEELLPMLTDVVIGHLVPNSGRVTTNALVRRA